jgi:CBS domain-containing protein
VTITPDTSISEARSMMSQYGIRHLPVVEKGKPISMVSDRDLGVAEAIFRESSKTPAAHVVRLLGHAHVLRVALDTPVDTVLDDMLRDRFDAVLVLDQGRLAGIFTGTDACRILAERLRSSADQPRPGGSAVS